MRATGMGKKKLQCEKNIIHIIYLYTLTYTWYDIGITYKIGKYITGTPRCRARRLDPNTRFREFIIPLCQKSSKASARHFIIYAIAGHTGRRRRDVGFLARSCSIRRRVTRAYDTRTYLYFFSPFHSDNKREFDRNIGVLIIILFYVTYRYRFTDIMWEVLCSHMYII